MITSIIVFVYIFFLLLSIGVIVKTFINKLSFIEKSSLESTPVDYYLIFGFTVLTALLAIISIFSKIGLGLHLTVFGIVFVGVIKYRLEFFRLFDAYKLYLKNNHSAFIYLVVVWPFFLLVLLYSVSSVQVFDTGLYHAQFIQWIQTYKAVPGLFWIHSRFAFNSHFHLSCAFFNFSFLDIRNFSGGSIIYYPLSSFFLLTLLSRCVFSVYEGAKKKVNFAIVLHALLFILCFFYFAPAIQSPSPDSITAILTLYVFFIFIGRISHRDRHQLLCFDHILLLSIILVLVTFKLSAVITILFLPFLLLRSKLSFKTLSLITLMGVFFVVPFFIRNSIISGWLIYPLPQIDLFSFDWKAPIEDLHMETKTVKAWARIPAVDPDTVLKMPMQEWVPLWWKNISDGTTANTLLLSICLINLVSPLLFFILFLVDKNKSLFKNYAILYGIILINLVFWFISAPDPRFATGYLFFNSAFILALALKRAENILSPKVIIGASFILLIWFIEIPKGHRDYFLEPYSRREIALYPKQLEIPVLEFITNSQGKLVISRAPKDTRCFNVKIPCAPYPNSSVLLRGNSLEDGFTYPSNSK